MTGSKTTPRSSRSGGSYALLPFLMAAALSGGLPGIAGCGGSGGGDAGKTAATVKILYDYSGKGDRSFSDSAYAGLVRVGEEHDLEVHEATPTYSADGSDVERILTGWLTAPLPPGPELIINTGFELTPPMEAALGAGCDQGPRHLLQLFRELPDCPQVKSVIFRTYAASYVAGAAATRMSRTKRVALLGAVDIPYVREHLEGFVAGVSRDASIVIVNPDFEFLDTSLEGFLKIDDAYDWALRMYEDEGVDIIFPVAGAAGMGVLEAAKQTGDATEPTARYTFGLVEDQTYLGQSVVLGSVVTRLDLVVRDAVREMVERAFEPGPQRYSLDDGSGYVDFVVNPRFEFEISCTCEDVTQDALDAQEAYGPVP